MNNSVLKNIVLPVVCFFLGISSFVLINGSWSTPIGITFAMFLAIILLYKNWPTR